MDKIKKIIFSIMLWTVAILMYAAVIFSGLIMLQIGYYCVTDVYVYSEEIWTLLGAVIASRFMIAMLKIFVSGLEDFETITIMRK